MRFILVSAAALVALSPSACLSSSAETDDSRAGESALTSVEASIVDFRFTGEVLATADAKERDAVVQQLLYTFGDLRTGGGGSGQVGNVRLANVRTSSSGDKKRISYEATLPVAWPKNEAPPTSYEIAVPRDITSIPTFESKYDGRCGKRVHGEGNLWHDWNPRAEGCTLDTDVVRAPATVFPHAEGMKRYPEYDRIWQDDRLDVTAIFTIIDSPERPNDWGYTEAQRFVETTSQRLQDVSIEPHRGSSSILSDMTIHGTAFVDERPREVAVDVLVIESVTDAGADFDERYDELSERADLILFNGHARLGANTNVLGRKGKVVAGKYQLVVLNACDTFALVDGTMVDRRRTANGERVDPNGTRFLDVVSNAHPGRSDNLANVSLEVFDAALRADQPESYGNIIRAMPKEHLVVVFGEEDNTFAAMRSHPAVYRQQALTAR